MDTGAELDRICRSLENQLASMSGDQEREYEVTDKTKSVIGKVTIPVDADEDDIIEILNLEGMLSEDREYKSDGVGEDDIIDITSDSDDEPIHEFSLTTHEDVEDFDEFMENILDIERTQYLSNGGWQTKSYTIVTGTGGPHSEFSTDYHIRAYWGGESREYYVGNSDARDTIDRVEDYLNDLYYEPNRR